MLLQSICHLIEQIWTNSRHQSTARVFMPAALPRHTLVPPREELPTAIGIEVRWKTILAPIIRVDVRLRKTESEIHAAARNEHVRIGIIASHSIRREMNVSAHRIKVVLDDGGTCMIEASCCCVCEIAAELIHTTGAWDAVCVIKGKRVASSPIEPIELKPPCAPCGNQS